MERLQKMISPGGGVQYTITFDDGEEEVWSQDGLDAYAALYVESRATD